MFTDEQIRTIVLRSTPVVCEKFNKTDCVEETCPDLHVCSKNILHDCASGDDCKLGHLIKDTEHNMWVLRTFHVERLPEKVLSKIVIVKKDVPQAASTAKDVPSKTPKASQGDGQEAADKDEKGKKSQNKSRSAMRKARSKETLQPDPVLSVPPTAGKTGGDVDQAAASSLRQRSPEQDAKQDDQRSPSGERPRPVPARRTKVPEVPRAVNPEASQYAHLCENHTWEGKCPRGYLCPRYHHRDRPPFVWQLQAFGDWQDFSKEDSFDIEKQFCQFANQETFEVVLDNIGGLKLSIHFGTLTATVEDAYTSASRISVYQNLQLRRWSTPSYMEAETKAPLNYYTQWCWYFMDTDGHLQPFRPELFQYTLEEKYISGQSKYFYEHGERQLMIHLQEMVQVDLDTGMAVSVFRRPIFHSVITSAPEMSSLLLKEPPAPLSHPPPTHWSKVDLLHDFELVELEKVGSEYQDVLRSFHATLDRSKASILRIFRVQNLNLWDKYCSTKRAMTPRDGSASDVDERRLFHGTPTLLGARGICANNMDFRRSGENVGALYGKGSYFSAHAIYSHSYTQGPHRYMFLAKVLVGKYTAGKPSYMSPPLREGLKLYDSCVNDEANPTIFVIFDLAQSYPEYLIQYEDSGAQGQGLAKTHSLGTLPATASVGTKPQPPERNPHSPHASADPARLLSHPSQNPALEAQSAALHGYYNARTQRSEFVGPERQGTGIEERQRAPYSGLAFDNPYGGSTGAQSVGGARATTQPNLQGRATPMSPPGQRAKKSNEDKCVLS
ncbi:hypothetical protein BaRGS_00038389 [Batillaria attramentaria]|uniref:Poly [ADP-ribose] polymerase n=1 Tax=Batillaria attramentaria TaxID=370345 RepID=A0ABD0J5Y7_9CAEN